ncbi:MAG: hypothetical protein A3D96_07530 [Chlamydiae bacterium RIFCSPHIGHO2_12_FULL_44_59]|nr:MAG: hypothetical protein A2796_06840 [Chlamydiae bacterium RIFCSPHIGHO2_01_FULL_44_39]OGN56986.1 MAG: hypothetical protein A3C42_03760 [Chlamydiae bacterium RIFCSPHIGHO2_02_FULL_45_9]OGN59538.1 MAG: hypothetical protein A3D96_07530 [Chlamydiae bacterium RIFCSPHIGHO2_12_FULL_44_59]OGN67283.1 MAG: hypothetical protein A2978_03360 [Chlamydiae bacterium RIFCSPLOWO2_01_FULL_44_52]OGN68705.1 MAG: hypothetical protein A3I67_03090 [Chlamydiae bacterium RIFCSPLOWO2_02_FULL_45_22]OGN69226.1 MAG: hyp
MSRTYLALTFLSIAVQALFAFFEMSCISFNKVRLQYYVSLGSRRATWLNYLLKRPSRLFGTTLIGITTFLVIGSECARRFYESIHLDPDWAPLTQVPLVVVFGELASMFAARRHPEQAAMFCVPLMFFVAKMLTPITWTFDQFSHILHKWMGKEKEVPLFLSREEVRLAFEEKDSKGDEFNATVNQIFQLKNMTAGQLMTSLANVPMANSSATFEEVRHLLSVHYAPIVPIYHRFPHNIVAIAQIRDLLSVTQDKRVIDSAHSPWFVAQNTSVLALLEQFKRNNQSTAVILEASGHAVGLLTLDQILATIFGKESSSQVLEESTRYIERTLSGEMRVAVFNQQFEANLPDQENRTLSDLILSQLDHFPVKEESICINEFAFTVDELTLRSVKTLTVRTMRY